LPKINLLWNY